MWYYRTLFLTCIFTTVVNNALGDSEITSLFETLTKLSTVRSLVATLNNLEELTMVLGLELFNRALAY